MTSNKSLGRFIVYRTSLSAVTIFAASIISFIIIQLPPGDFVSSYVAQLAQTGVIGSTESIEQMRRDFGLDQPMIVRYLHWAADANGIIARVACGIVLVSNEDKVMHKA